MISQARSTKLNPMLMKVIFISILLHVVAGFVAGVVKIAYHVIEDDSQFEEPPAVVEEVPPPEVKVKIQPPKQQQQMPEIRMKPVTAIAVAQIDVDLPDMADNFTVTAGLGSGLGGGLGGSGTGFGLELPELNFFGAKSKGEKVTFVVHFGPATSGTTPYDRMTAYTIRKRLEELVGGLPDQAFFNVAAYWAKHCNPFATKMLQATNTNKQLLIDWMEPVNPVEGSTKTYGSGFDAKFSKKLATTPWGTRVENGPNFGPAWYYNYVIPQQSVDQYFPKDTQQADYHWGRGVIWAMLEQQPDTIFVLTTNYLPSQPAHPEQFAKAYEKICQELYDIKGLKRPTINVVVLARAGQKAEIAERTLAKFSPIIRVSRGDGSVIRDIAKFMNTDEKKRLEAYRRQAGK